MSVPDLAIGIPLPAEQDCLRLVTGNQHQHRFGFGESGEEIKVAVVPVIVMRVGIASDFRRGGYDGDTVLHLLQQALASLLINGGVEIHGAFCDVRSCLSSSARRC